VSVRARYTIWIAASAVAGLVVVLALGCGGGSWWRGLIALAIPPALFLAPLIRWFGGHAVRWLLLTVVGVFACYASTFAVYVVIGALMTAFAERGVDGGRFEGWLGTASFLIVMPFLGGVALGILQLPAVGRASRSPAWIVATMVGSVAIGPIAFLAVLGGETCRPSSVPWWIVGMAGGLIYGIATAIALGLRPRTLIGAPPRPLPPDPHAP
jgi:hypothetical protein